MAPSHETKLRVRYAETDQMGVVHHSNYLVWMEAGRLEYCESAGLRYRDLERDEGVLLAVVEVHCRYLHPARYDEEVVVRTRLESASPRMLRFGYEIRPAAGNRMLAEGYTKHVFCGRDMKPARLPAKYHALFGIGRSAQTPHPPTGNR